MNLVLTDWQHAARKAWINQMCWLCVSVRKSKSSSRCHNASILCYPDRQGWSNQRYVEKSHKKPCSPVLKTNILLCQTAGALLLWAQKTKLDSTVQQFMYWNYQQRKMRRVLHENRSVFGWDILVVFPHILASRKKFDSDGWIFKKIDYKDLCCHSTCLISCLSENPMQRKG